MVRRLDGLAYKKPGTTSGEGPADLLQHRKDLMATKNQSKEKTSTEILGSEEFLGKTWAETQAATNRQPGKEELSDGKRALIVVLWEKVGLGGVHGKGGPKKSTDHEEVPPRMFTSCLCGKRREILWGK